MRLLIDMMIQNGTKVTLIQACGLGMLDRVKTLLADAVNQVEEGTSPLIAASVSEHADIVRYLLEHEADANLTANKMRAIDGAKTADVIELLEKHGGQRGDGN